MSKPRFKRIDYVLQTGGKEKEIQSVTMPLSDTITPKEQLRQLGDQGNAPSNIVGKCSSCNVVVALEFPYGYDYSQGMKVGEKVMQYKPVRAYCISCRRMVDFVPIKDPKVIHRLLGEAHDNLKGDFLKNIEGGKQ